jgi:hypothetical protein
VAIEERPAVSGLEAPFSVLDVEVAGVRDGETG